LEDYEKKVNINKLDIEGYRVGEVKVVGTLHHKMLIKIVDIDIKSRKVKEEKN